MTNFDFEEIFADVTQHPRRSATPEHLEAPVHHIAIRLFLVGALLLLSGFGYRAWELSVRQGASLADAALEARQRRFLVSANRGAILDYHGSLLVTNEPGFALLFDPLAARAADPDEVTRLIELAAEQLMLSPEGFLTAIQAHGNRADELVLEDDVAQDIAVALSATLRSDIMRIVPSAIRKYVADDPAFSTVLGYMGAIDADEVDAYVGYELNDAVGKDGIEKQYEAVLRGQPGERRVTVDAAGERKGEVGRQAQGGASMRLTIDAELTRVAANALQAGMRRAGATGGAVVALDPRDGAVRAMISLPTFSAADLSSGISNEAYTALTQRGANPFLNRAVNGTYPAGSTIKPFIAAAGLEGGVISANTRIDASEGFITVQSVYDEEISWTFPDWKPHGIINVMEAIARSSNVFFYIVGGGFGNIEGLGIDRVTAALNGFGFGTLLGIDLPGEASGRVPTPEWKREAIGEAWYIGDTYNVSIGQGNFTTTPLQLAAATAAVANGGTLWRPRLLDALLDAQGNVVEDVEPVAIREVPIRDEHLQTVRRGMRFAVTQPYGTNGALASLPITAAAKTGTAQFGSTGGTHALVTTFAPYENPEIVLAVVLEAGGGGTGATAVARDILEWYATQVTD